MTELSDSNLMELRNNVLSVQKSIGQKVIGAERIVRFMFIALMSDNHVLLEGVPGLAKTMLASEFSSHLGMEFKRIQFTPDMLPSDVTGSIVFNLETRKMEFRKGPIFANVLLADEINRTPPKVHSALLEAMEEKQVSVGGDSQKVPEPFLVIATQNPIEQEGTFPLAEALMDRFLFRYIMTYPTREEEMGILRSTSTYTEPPESILGPELIMRLREEVSEVYASEEIMNYIVNITRKTREHDNVYIGASPRTTAKFLKAAKANALINGRNYVIPEDIIYLCTELLNHRIILKPEAMIENGADVISSVKRIISGIVSEVEPPQ